ncbi:MAG: VOC family protein [Propionicimonas sp.]
MAPIFRQLHHICIVVADLEATEAAYRQLGIADWYDYPKHGPYLEYEVPNPEGSANLRYRCCDLANVQLQLCQPGSEDTPQRRFLDEHGEGVYHLGFEVADLPGAVAAGHDLGLDVISRGLRGDGSGFAYFDTRDLTKVTLEVRRTPAEQE